MAVMVMVGGAVDLVEIYALVGASCCEDALGGRLLRGWLCGWGNGEAADGGGVGMEEEVVGEGNGVGVGFEGDRGGYAVEDALVGPGDYLEGDWATLFGGGGVIGGGGALSFDAGLGSIY